MSQKVELTRKELCLIEVALRLRAEACEENAEYKEALKWLNLLIKIEKALGVK